MTQPTPSLKPFAAWVTDLTDKYRFNQSVRTTVNIILLQLGLTLLSILVFGWAIQYAQQDTVGSITLHVQQVLSGVSMSPDALPQTILDVRNRTFLYVFTGMILLNILFAYLIAQFALRPTRQSFSFQKRFIGNIAHEIRTPLSIIKTSTEVALFDPTLPKTVRATMEDTIGELNRISETINNLLSFDSLTQPKTMQFSHVDLSDVARTVVARHREFAASRGVRLTSNIMKEGFINGNATALDQVVYNLTKNALHFTPKNKGGQVTVMVERNQRGDVVLSVIDTGIGIAQKDIYHIFDPFYRADTSRARGIGTGSSGLGLAIVNEIVRLHHGTIILRSSVGHGTTVKITFSAASAYTSTLPLLVPTGKPNEATLDFSKDA